MSVGVKIANLPRVSEQEAQGTDDFVVVHGVDNQASKMSLNVVAAFAEKSFSNNEILLGRFPGGDIDNLSWKFQENTNTGAYLSDPANGKVSFVSGGNPVFSFDPSGVNATNVFVSEDQATQDNALTRKDYVDVAVSTAKSSAESYADTVSDAAEYAAREYADTKSQQAQSAAESYADTILKHVLSYDLFLKPDPDSPAFVKTNNYIPAIKSGLHVSFPDGSNYVWDKQTEIDVTHNDVGVDHAIWVCNDGRAKASENFTAPPDSGVWRLIGGFHFAPGGNAPGLNKGGDDAPQINEHSFWDLKFRPTCPDPRGMTLVANNVWVDIYLTGAEAIVNGSSKYNVEIADGSSPPKIPMMFGGDGSANYGSYTWFEACELAQSFGKRLPTQQEFMAAAFGTTEASSTGKDQLITKLNEAYTSKWGLIQATGVMSIWGIERGGSYAGNSWNANTDGRGSEYAAPNAALFGGTLSSDSNSGSRCSSWSSAASYSSGSIGSRFAADHLQLD